jgi:hypothetical protein
MVWPRPNVIAVIHYHAPCSQTGGIVSPSLQPCKLGLGPAYGPLGGSKLEKGGFWHILGLNKESRGVLEKVMRRKILLSDGHEGLRVALWGPGPSEASPSVEIHFYPFFSTLSLGKCDFLHFLTFNISQKDAHICLIIFILVVLGKDKLKKKFQGIWTTRGGNLTSQKWQNRRNCLLKNEFCTLFDLQYFPKWCIYMSNNFYSISTIVVNEN